MAATGRPSTWQSQGPSLRMPFPRERRALAPMPESKKSCSEDPGEVHEKKSTLDSPHHQAGGPGGDLHYNVVHQQSHTEVPEDSKQDCGPETSSN